MSFRFARFSPIGHVAAQGPPRHAGGASIYLNNQAIGPGVQPVWLTPDTILYRAPAPGVSWDDSGPGWGLWVATVAAQTPVYAAPLPCSWLDACATNAWVAELPGAIVQTSDGRRWEGYVGPALAPDGRVALRRHQDGALDVVRPLDTGPQSIDTRPCADLRWGGDALVYTARVDGHSRVQMWTDPAPPVDLQARPGDEFGPVLVDRGQYLLTYDHDGLYLREVGRRAGWVLDATADTYEPDARLDQVGYCWLAYGRLQRPQEPLPVRVDLSTRPVVDLAIWHPPGPAAAVLAPDGTPIDDVRAFVLGDPGNFPRHGTHEMAQVVEYRSVTWLKFGPAKAGVIDGVTPHWERWGWDDQWIHHLEDHGYGGDVYAGEWSRVFGKDRRWLPRACRSGDTVTVQTTLRIFHKVADRWVVAHTRPFSYVVTVRLWLQHPLADGGPALEQVYDQRPTRDADGRLKGFAEHNLYVQGRGWMRWRQYHQDEANMPDVLTAETTWPEPGGTPLRPTPGVVPHAWWTTPIVVPPGGIPRVTIAGYEPDAGPAPLRVRALATISGLTAAQLETGGFQLQWVVDGRVDVTNPAWDPDHTYTLPPGGHDLSVRLLAPDGHILDQTARPRRVTVSGPDPPDPPIGPPEDAREWRGNFLANGLERFAFLYPGWTDDRRARFRARYRAQGWTHLPIGIWGEYRGQDRFDYRDNVAGYRRLLVELRDAGILPCVFVVTDTVGSAPAIVPANADAFVRRYLPQIVDLVPTWCLGWELNQVKGWSEHDDRRSGHYMIALARSIRRVIGDGAPLYYHLQPEWWGPHYEDGDEDRWLRDCPEVSGQLWQGKLEAPVADVLHLAYTLPRGDGARGICGRLAARGRDFVLFEAAREWDRWTALVAGIQGRGRGFC